MTSDYPSVLEFGLEPATQLLNRGFADYFVPVQMPVAGLLGMARQDSVDLTLSRVVVHDGQPAGVALVARRGWTSRLAAMAVVPEARGKGVGEACVRQLLAEARARGERAMTLEVIEQNAPAVSLYAKCGFKADRRLVGYTGRPEGGESAGLEEVDVREVARALITHGPADLPWQLSGETLAQAGPPGVAYRSGPAWLALSNPGAPVVGLRAVVVEPHARRRGLATALLRAASARHPGKEWRVPAIWPEDLGGLFEKLGLKRDPLTQWQMTIRF